MALATPPKCLRLKSGLLLLAAVAALPLAAASTEAEDPASLIVVVGAAGQDEFGDVFATWAGQWKQVGEQAGVSVKTVGLTAVENTTDLEHLQQLLEAEIHESTAELWLVMIGHGTFDAQGAKFNLKGPDLSAQDLAAALAPFKRPIAILNTSSASAPFVNALSGPNRVVVTATKSGAEQNYARFGEHLAQAIHDPTADLDKDGQTSILEAFLAASRSVQEWYDLEGRLATEHALLDDNGDALGTPATWFRGIRAVKKAKTGASPDGLRAHQFHLLRSELEQRIPQELRARRDQIELAISALRDRKDTLAEDSYYAQLEELLLEIARLYETADPAPASQPAPATPPADACE